MFKNMNQNKFKIVLIVLVVALLVVVAYFVFFKKQNKDNSFVYLTTGEMYIGKLTTFPSLEFKNGYIMQVTKDETDPTKNKFQLVPLKDALWAPQTLHLIKKNVVFYGKLSPDSKIAQTIAGQAVK